MVLLLKAWRARSYAHTYPFRVVNVEMSFDRPGNYTAVLQFYTSSAQAAPLPGSTFDFPLRVGTGQSEVLIGIALCLTLVLLGGGLAAYAACRYQQRKVSGGAPWHQ
jgi:hypothetical protein